MQKSFGKACVVVYINYVGGYKIRDFFTHLFGAVMAQEKIYKMVTDRIIEQLENGVIPWRQPWKETEGPKNIVSKKAYRGMNYFLLAHMADEWYLTFNQAKQLGGRIKKGASALPVIFWKMLQVEDAKSGEIKTVPFLRYYNVFALSDTEGIECPKKEDIGLREFSPIYEAQRIIGDMPNQPTIQHGGNRAVYRPSSDTVTLPVPESFSSAEEYYCTAFHELVHSTGHKSRLHRDELVTDARFGSHAYSKEELTAEMGAAFLSGHAGFAHVTLDNSAAYIRGWLNRLRNDHKLLIQAAGKAQKAADYIIGEYQEENDTAA